MTEDPAKFPRAKASPPTASLLDRQVSDAKSRMLYSATEDLRRYYADRLVGLQFERGDFPMIQALDGKTRAALVAATLKEIS